MNWKTIAAFLDSLPETWMGHHSNPGEAVADVLEQKIRGHKSDSRAYRARVN
jgi:hypothetical protein